MANKMSCDKNRIRFMKISNLTDKILKKVMRTRELAKLSNSLKPRGQSAYSNKQEIQTNNFTLVFKY